MLPKKERSKPVLLLSLPLIVCALGIGAVAGGACATLGCFSFLLPSPTPLIVPSPTTTLSSAPTPAFSPWSLSSPTTNPGQDTLTDTILDPAFDPLAAGGTAQLPPSVLLDVPFTSQAPAGVWDGLHEEACEEASAIMVDAFLNDQLLTKATADEAIKALITWEQDNGYAVDVTAAELATILSGYFDREAKIYTDTDVTVENIKRLLAAGHPVILPAAGRLLANPHFTPPGPQYHMLVLIGYDETRFIANDPGTRRGAGYHYPFETILSAIHDWTGDKDTIAQGRKVMVVVEKSES